MASSNYSPGCFEDAVLPVALWKAEGCLASLTVTSMIFCLRFLDLISYSFQNSLFLQLLGCYPSFANDRLLHSSISVYLQGKINCPPEPYRPSCFTFDLQPTCVSSCSFLLRSACSQVLSLASPSPLSPRPWPLFAVRSKNYFLFSISQLLSELAPFFKSRPIKNSRTDMDYPDGFTKFRRFLRIQLEYSNNLGIAMLVRLRPAVIMINLSTVFGLLLGITLLLLTMPCCCSCYLYYQWLYGRLVILLGYLFPFWICKFALVLIILLIVS